MSRRSQLILFAVGIGAFVLLVYQAGPGMLLQQIRDSGMVLIPVILIYGLVYLLNSEAWRLVMHDRPPRISSPRSYAITAWAFALNYVTPMVSVGGEPFKIVAASRWLGRRGAAASVLGERLLHMQGHLLFFLTGIVLAFIYLPRTAIGMVPLAFVATLLLAAGSVSLIPYRRGGALRLLDLLGKTPLPRRWREWLALRRDGAAEIDAQLTTFYRDQPARYAVALLMEYAARCISVVEMLLVGWAIGVPIDYWTAYLIVGFASFAVNAMFVLPFGLGAREGGLYVIFALLGLPPQLGVVASIFGRIRELAWIALGFLLGFLAVRPAALKATPAPDTTPPSP